VSDADFLDPLLITFALATLSALICCAVAAPMGWLVARTDMPLRRTVRLLVTASFVTPPFLGAIAWELLAAPNSGLLNQLYREITGDDLDKIRLLSGPPKPERLDDLKDEYKRFRKEMKDERGIDAEWRALNSQEAFKHHDRFFITEGLARNLPPVNSILANSTGEILPSELTTGDFDEWWTQAGPLTSFSPPKK